MFSRSFAGALKQKSNAFKVGDPKRTEARAQAVYTKLGISYEDFWLSSCLSKHSYFVQRYFSQSAFNEAFSDFSKQQFIKCIQEIKCKNNDHSVKDAAVLVPLCKINSKSSVLLTLRSSNLGRNKGDVSFPGGMRDSSDKDVIHSALRETEEEIGIVLDVSQVWTTMPSISRSGMHVTPVIAFLGDVNVKDFAVNENEVEDIFSLTLESLCDPHNQFYTEFKPGYSLPVYIVKKHRVWGLTAGILHHFLKILLPNVYKNNLPLVYKGFRSRTKK